MVKYSYANLTRDESMRILKVLPGEPQDHIHCHLDHLRKDQDCDYDALSYAWDDQEPTSSVTIISQNILYDLPIIPNLEAALRQLRHPYHDLVLWVDAICINQDSNDEKSHQVPQMSKIYSEANKVRVWLGEEIPFKSEIALKFVSRILDFENFDRLIADSRLVAEWASLLSLMKSSWFGRRWVLQEVALARKAYLHCGKDWVSWDDFADAVRLFEERTPTIQEHFMKASELGFRSDLVQDIEAMSATRLVHATSDLFRKSNDGHILEWMQDLETLVSELSAFQASNPRDVIYGVLALARDTRSTANKRVIGQEIAMPPNARGKEIAPSIVPEASEPITPPRSDRKRKVSRGSESKVKRQRFNGLDPTAEFAGPSTRSSRTHTPIQASGSNPKLEELAFTAEQKRLVKLIMNKLRDRIAARTFNVNYDKSLFHVCKDFLVFVTRKSKNLDIICRPWAPDSEDLPSWIPKLSAGSHVKRNDGTFLRINADPLVGGPNRGRQIYNASKSFEAKFSFGDGFRRQNPKSLLVQGIILDTIGKTTRLPAVSGDIPKEWPDFAGWKDISAYPPNQFWMTLVAGRGPDGLNPPDYYRRACQYAFKKRGPGGPLDVRYMLADPAFNTIAKEFLKRMQSVVWMRLLMITEKKHILGLVSHEAQPGDRICILFGCSVPVVLREEAHGSGANAGTHYKFLGDAFVEGMMDGQALDSEEGQAKNYRMFDLR